MLYYMLHFVHNILKTGTTLETNTSIDACINTLTNFSLGNEKKNKKLTPASNKLLRFVP